MGAPDGDRSPPRLVLYDGVCGFCNRAVRRLLEADRRGVLRFSPLQGPTADALRRRHPQIPERTDTLLYVTHEDGDERVHLRSEAVFRIAADLDGPWRRLAWLRLLPRWLTDLGYRLFARVRYRLFGRLDACPAPPPEHRARFLP